MRFVPIDLDRPDVRSWMDAMMEGTGRLPGVASVARLFAEAGSVCIVSFTSPTRSERERARRVMDIEDGPGIPFVETYLSTANDSSSQYEPPERPEMTLAENVPLEERVNRVLELLMRQIR